MLGVGTKEKCRMSKLPACGRNINNKNKIILLSVIPEEQDTILAHTILKGKFIIAFFIGAGSV